MLCIQRLSDVQAWTAALTSSGTATDATIVPLLEELFSAFDNATTTLKALSGSDALTLKRQLADISTLLSDILSVSFIYLYFQVIANMFSNAYSR